MDLRPPLTAAMDAFSVPVTVTPPGGAPIATTGIWVAPDPEDQPIGRDYSVLEPRRVMSLPRDEVSEVETGTVIVAVESIGGVSRNWQIDRIQSADVDEFRVFLIPKTS